MELNTIHPLSDTSFNRGMSMFDEQRLVELISAIDSYSMVAMTLNAFDIRVPGEKKLLD